VPAAVAPHPSDPDNPCHPLPSPVVIVVPLRRSISLTEPRPPAPWSTLPAGGHPNCARTRRGLTSPPLCLPQGSPPLPRAAMHKDTAASPWYIHLHFLGALLAGS
uniref:Uncharacterized protein n=1 Tax=Triticum urartu TaxID=4572 RepID=A0A8R7R3H2_TRIUA